MSASNQDLVARLSAWLRAVSGAEAEDAWPLVNDALLEVERLTRELAWAKQHYEMLKSDVANDLGPRHLRYAAALERISKVSPDNYAASESMSGMGFAAWQECADIAREALQGADETKDAPPS